MKLNMALSLYVQFLFRFLVAVAIKFHSFCMVHFHDFVVFLHCSILRASFRVLTKKLWEILLMMWIYMNFNMGFQFANIFFSLLLKIWSFRMLTFPQFWCFVDSSICVFCGILRASLTVLTIRNLDYCYGFHGTKAFVFFDL